MVSFHEDMINALTWLTSAESKVAELDSAVEATSTEDQQDTEALRKELKVSVVCAFEWLRAALCFDILSWFKVRERGWYTGERCDLEFSVSRAQFLGPGSFGGGHALVGSLPCSELLFLFFLLFCFAFSSNRMQTC